MMWFIWYPSPYFRAMGGDKLMLLLLGVDVVLGPLVTAIVFDRNKKSLKFDLGTIALIQLLALGYGSHVMFAARPVYNVFSIDRFDVVAANEIDPRLLARAKQAEFKSVPLFGPRIVAARMPENTDLRREIMFSSLAGVDLQHYPECYLSIEKVTSEMLAVSRPAGELFDKHPDTRTVLEQLAAKSRTAVATLRYVRMRARSSDVVMVLNALGHPLGPVEIL
jgi:hypothetical protein